MKKSIQFSFMMILSFLSVFTIKTALSNEIAQIENTNIITSAPDGFEEVTDKYLLNVMSTVAVPTSNTLHKLYITNKDSDLIRNNINPTPFKDYLMIQSPKMFPYDTSVGDFQKVRDIDKDLMDKLTTDPKISKRIQNLSNSNIGLAFQYDANLELGQPTNLGQIFNTNEAYCYESLVKTSMNNIGTTVKSTATMINVYCGMLLNKKIIYAYLFKRLEKEEDILNAKKTSIEWATQLIKLNPNYADSSVSFHVNNIVPEEVKKTGFISSLSDGLFVLMIGILAGAIGFIAAYLKFKK